MANKAMLYLDASNQTQVYLLILLINIVQV